MRRKVLAIFFWSCPSTFGSTSTISRFGFLLSAFVMVSTVLSVSCLLFYSRCSPCPAISKSGGTYPRAPWSRRYWTFHEKRSSRRQHNIAAEATLKYEELLAPCLRRHRNARKMPKICGKLRNTREIKQLLYRWQFSSPPARLCVKSGTLILAAYPPMTPLGDLTVLPSLLRYRLIGEPRWNTRTSNGREKKTRKGRRRYRSFLSSSLFDLSCLRGWFKSIKHRFTVHYQTWIFGAGLDFRCVSREPCLGWCQFHVLPLVLDVEALPLPV